MHPTQILCKICLTPVKVTDTYIRFVCMCDEDVRTLPKEDIYRDEHNWRIYSLNNKKEKSHIVQ